MAASSLWLPLERRFSRRAVYGANLGLLFDVSYSFFDHRLDQ